MRNFVWGILERWATASVRRDAERLVALDVAERDYRAALARIRAGDVSIEVLRALDDAIGRRLKLRVGR